MLEKILWDKQREAFVRNSGASVSPTAIGSPIVFSYCDDDDWNSEDDPEKRIEKEILKYLKTEKYLGKVNGYSVQESHLYCWDLYAVQLYHIPTTIIPP